MANLSRVLSVVGSTGAIVLHLTVGKQAEPQRPSAIDERRNLVVATAVDLVGIRETTGRNDGPEVARILATVGLPEGHPYCAATNYAAHLWSNEKLPGRPADYAWSPTWARADRVVWNRSLPWHSYQFVPGDVITLYYPNLGRVGHTGIAIAQEGSYLVCVEGNTNEAGSREGQGVYLKRRKISLLHNITRWIK